MTMDAMGSRIPGVNPMGPGAHDSSAHVSSQGAVLMAAQLSRFGTGLLRLGLGGNDLKE